MNTPSPTTPSSVSPDSESAASDSATPASTPPSPVWLHRPYADDPRIGIPIRCSLGSPLNARPGTTPAQREVAAASAELCLGLLPESRARILNVNLDDLMPCDAWQAVEIIARHICAQGDWHNAAFLVSEQWKRLRVAVADGEQPPGRRTTYSAVILQAAGDVALAAQICASVIYWGGCPLDHYQFACAASRLGKPVQALSTLLWIPEERCYARYALYDPDFAPMWEAFATQRQSRRTRRLLAVMFGPAGTRLPQPPALTDPVDVISFRALPRHFAPLFTFDPVSLLYELNSDALSRANRASRLRMLATTPPPSSAPRPASRNSFVTSVAEPEARW